MNKIMQRIFLFFLLSFLSASLRLPASAFFFCALPEHASLYTELANETEKHVQYLSAIGLAERAKMIHVGWFQEEKTNSGKINLAPFSKRSKIPQEVLEFDPRIKNTIITTDPLAESNKAEDLRSLLDIRLYPVLRKLMMDHRIEVFLGMKHEMAAYYKAKGDELLFEFSIPSSATYYLAESAKRELFVVMSGLVSRENLIAQLLTLKLADLKVEEIEIIGEPEHFTELVKEDIAVLLNQLPVLKKAKQVLIVAGCGLEGLVSEMIVKEFLQDLGKEQIFSGQIISLRYLPLLEPVNGIHGFISLNQNYGEITEEILKQLLENCNCRYVFTGGAGGYIARDAMAQKPAIGTRIAITSCMNEQGGIAKLPNPSVTNSRHVSSMHLQVPSIFLETYPWLEKARKRGESVDVETFYMIRALQHYLDNHPSENIEVDCGYFVSDYVGKQPLRDYSKVFQSYPDVLSGFIRKIMN